MTIQVGDRLPDMPLTIATSEGPKPTTTGDYFGGRKVALFAVPGAFTPTCSTYQLPDFEKMYPEFKAEGIDEIYCISVNDAFVMGAWGRDQKSTGIVRMMADGNATFTKALGLDNDYSAHGMGVRSKRYAMLVEDGVVKTLDLDAKGVEASSAEAMLEKLG